MKKAEEVDGSRASLEVNLKNWQDGYAEMWSPLKASELAGASWRKRDKLLAQLADKLNEIGTETSLLAGLQVALKMNVKTRSDFAQATIACAEDAYAKHVDILKERVDNFGAEISASSAEVAEAEAGVQAANDANSKAIEASIEAQNLWAAETDVELKHQTKVERFQPTVTKLSQKLAQAQADL